MRTGEALLAGGRGCSGEEEEGFLVYKVLRSLLRKQVGAGLSPGSGLLG